MIVHPRGVSERVDELRTVVHRLRRQGHAVVARLTFEAGDASHFARVAVARRVDLIIAAGGDGTVNEVVNGMGRARWQPRLGIIPIGTANDFANGLGLPETVEGAARVAVTGRPIAVDVGRVNVRLFVNVSTGGFGAEAMEHTSTETKRLLGRMSYVVTGVREFVELHPTRARFMVGRETIYAGRFLLFAVGNARQTGGGSLLTPRADFADGKLDVMVVKEMPRFEFLALLPDLRAGTHLGHPGVLYVQTPTLRVDTAEQISVNADGEPMRASRFHYAVRPRPLTVMTP